MTDNRNGFLLGILIGGVGGAIAALLYAPSKGEETREQVKQKARDAKERASDAVMNAKERASEAVANAKGRASEAVESAKDSAEQLTAKGMDYVDTKKAQVKAAVDAGRQAAAEKEAELRSKSSEASEPRGSM